MNTKEFLSRVSNEIKYKPANKPISEELEGHINDIKDDYLCKGYSEEVAEEKAVEDMGDAKKIGKNLNKIHRPKLDWVILLLIALLLAFNVILSLKTFMEWQDFYGFDFNIKDFVSTYSYEIKYFVQGLILGIIVYFFDYRKTRKWANIFYLLATGAILFQWFDQFALDGLMNKILGDPRGMTWFVNMRLWNVSIPLYIIAFAGYMANYQKEDFWDTAIPFILSCLLLYIKSESITNTLILVISYLAIIATKMLQENKTRKKVISTCGGFLAASLAVMLLMTQIIIIPIFDGRHTTEDTWNNFAKTQERQAEILQNVKWLGEANTQLRSGTNFQFIYILGMLGIIPGILLFVTIVFMSIRLIRNSKHIKDNYGKYLIIGLSATYILQSIIQVLMNLNILPTSDVNLPFISAGKLYFLINSFTFGVILSVYRRKNINFEENDVKECEQT